ncbi:uncharacterized protein [Solanum lycopersicum]|uniref:uncharacterized protein n=1 Tax=Solanum lycopersicum TaxID=4081 RepID=UPI0037497C1A
MARGRGRGRGRGRKTPIMTIGSSVGARVEAIELNQQEQVQNEEDSFEDRLSVSSKVSRNLSLNNSLKKEEVHENSDLERFDGENKVDGNGTVIEGVNSNRGKEGKKSKEYKEPWVNMFKNNCAANNRINLTYFPPQIVNGQTMVQLEGKEVHIEEEKWKCALIAYVIGECPGYNTMNRYLLMNWSKVDKPDVFLYEEGYIIKFKSLNDMNEVLFSGSYTISNRPIILKQWCPDFNFENEFLTKILLWVNFPKLPLNCWGVGSLSRIASVIGVPLFVDECTTKQTRTSYSRMLIEVNVTKPIPQKVTVMDPNGRTYMQEVVMEWKPLYCDKCQKIGHQCQSATMEDLPKKRRPWKKVTQTWQYKGPIQQQEWKVKQSKVLEHIEDDNTSFVQEEKQEIEQRGEQEIKQTPDLNLRPNTGTKHLEFSLSNFPMLSAIPMRNGFESLMNSKLASLPVDRGLIETRVKEGNAKATIKSIAPGWRSLNNYKEAANGRIWIIWDESWYDIKLITSSAQMIHCHINERSKGYQFNLTVVYDFNTIEQRKSLWTDLNLLVQSVTHPWLIIGDFNALLSSKDRQDGALVTLNEIKDFAECVKDIGINEIQWKGNYYTYNNKHIGNARISSRIDRALGNDAWMDKWGHVILEYENPGVSDHSSMQLLLHQNYQQVIASFKFFNVWIEHESFLELVEKV